MIYIKDGNVEYNVRWSHQPELKTELHGFVDGKPTTTQINGMTTCSVFMMDGSEPLEYVGQAYCSVKDIYNKEKGRRVSLARAVESLPYETRKLIWEKYLAR